MASLLISLLAAMIAILASRQSVLALDTPDDEFAYQSGVSYTCSPETSQ